jgi:hypothetical protein
MGSVQKLRKKMVNCTAYSIEADPELGEHWYRVCHTKGSEVISWGQHKFKVKADKVNGSYSCECRELEHTSIVESRRYMKRFMKV